MNPQQSLEHVIDLAQQRCPAPDAILLTGDLAHDGDYQTYARLLDALQPLCSHLLPLPGNHDQPAVLTQAMQQFGLSKQLDLGCWLVLAVDSSVPEQVHGHLGSSEWQWLEHQLQTRLKPTVVCIHHPPIQTGSQWMDDIGLTNTLELQAMLGKYPQVKLVLAGHVHQALDVQKDHYRVLTTPSTNRQFAQLSEQFAISPEQPGFRSVVLHANGQFDTSIHRVASPL